MSPVFAARRRAEEFDSLVQAVAAGPVERARYAELLELVGALRDVAPVEPRPAFVADLRERLMTAAATELVPAPDVQDRLSMPRRSPREKRLAVAVGGFAIIGATTSMAVAAQSALPGDVLYPLKRAIENAHTGLSVDDEQKGSTLLANASGRLEEVDRLTRSAEVQELDVRIIEDTLTTFTEQATEASDLMLAAYAADGDDDAIAELQDFTAQSFQALNQLAVDAAEPIRDALVPVGNALAAIEAAVQQACPSCDSVLTSIPPWMLASAEELAAGLGGLIATTPPTTIAVPTPGQGQGKGRGEGRGGRPEGQDDQPDQEPPTDDQPPVDVPDDPTDDGGGDGGGSTGTGGPSTPPEPNAVDDLVGDLLGTGGGSTTTGQPELPVVGPVLDGLGQVIEDLTAPLAQP